MPFAPRDDEVAAVEQLLESEEFKDGHALAYAIVKAVTAELGKRRVYAIQPSPQAFFLYGPYYTEHDAREAWETIGQAEGQAGKLASIYPWNPPEDVAPSCVCGHKAEQHVVTVRQGKTSKPKDCGVCECKNFSSA